MSAPVWLVCGAQASGKTTTADLLARRFERGVHLRGAQLYRWAVTGWVHPFAGDEDEARRLLDLRYRLSAQLADEYAGAGFTTVVQDTIYGDDVTRWLDRVHARPLHLVVLELPASTIAERDRQRIATRGKVAYREGFTIDDNIRAVELIPRIGLWLDTSAMTPDEVVDAILARSDESLVS